MKLEELLEEELYKQVKEKIDAANANEPDKLKHIRYADLSEGEYVSKGKYDTAVAEKENLAGQVKTLNTTINDLKKNNADNEALQNTITDLQTKLKDQQTANEQISKRRHVRRRCRLLRPAGIWHARRTRQPDRGRTARGLHLCPCPRQKGLSDAEHPAHE